MAARGGEGNEHGCTTTGRMTGVTGSRALASHPSTGWLLRMKDVARSHPSVQGRQGGVGIPGAVQATQDRQQPHPITGRNRAPPPPGLQTDASCQLEVQPGRRDISRRRRRLPVEAVGCALENVTSYRAASVSDMGRADTRDCHLRQLREPALSGRHGRDARASHASSRGAAEGRREDGIDANDWGDE